MAATQGVFDDKGTRQYAMSGYTGHKQGVLDHDYPSNKPQSNGQIPGKLSIRLSSRNILPK